MLILSCAVAILREQGVNGYAEMAFAFRAAGFDAVDVHMSDILDGLTLDGFRGLAACGGFSYGDVLGAGIGWAQSVLMHDGARRIFEAFFNRPDTFTLGVCNGCQMIARLKELIPGAENWPNFGMCLYSSILPFSILTIMFSFPQLKTPVPNSKAASPWSRSRKPPPHPSSSPT